MPQPVAVRDMFQARPIPSTGPGIPILAVRPMQPTTVLPPTTTLTANYTVRGTIPVEPLGDAERQSILTQLERDTLGGSGARVRDSNWNTWRTFHDRWFGGSVSYLPLTPITIAAVAGQMKARGYRSFPGFLTAARDHHIEAGHSWTDLLNRARRRYSASTQRGIGPPRQSLEACPRKIVALGLGNEPIHDEGPICPRHWAVLCSFHMLRGAESSSALASALSINTTDRRETLMLPKSKTDKQAVGCKRTWRCVCPVVCQGEDAMHSARSQPRRSSSENSYGVSATQRAGCLLHYHCSLRQWARLAHAMDT